MADTKYKIGVEITGDDSKFRASAKSSEKAVSDLEKKSSSDFAKIAKNFGGIFEGKAKDTGLGKFAGEVGEGTAALSAFTGPTAIVTGGVVALGTAAVATGATLFALAKDASDYGSEIADAQSKTGLAADSLSALRYQANLSGSDFGQVSGAVTKFSKLVGEAASGSDEAKGKLKALGIDPQEAMRDLDGALGKAFKTINDAKPGVNQMTAAQNAFGKSGADLIPTIRGMNGDFAALKKQAEALGVVLSEADVMAADEFGDTLDTLKMQATGAANNFAYGFMPKITSAMRGVSGELRDNKDVWREWGEWVGEKIELATRNMQFYLAIAKSFNEYRTTGVVTSLPAFWEQDAENQRITKNQKDIADYVSKGAPDWMKGQFGDLDKLGRKLTIRGNADGTDYVNNLGGSAKKKEKTEAQKTNWNSSTLAEFARNQGFKPGDGFAKTGHNVGSLHGLNRALDIGLNASNQGKTVNQIVQMMENSIKAGIRVVDERVRPKGQKKWSAAHVHLEENDNRASSFNPNLDYGGRLEYLKALDKERLSGKGKSLADALGTVNKAEIGEGAKALADYDKQLKLLGVTTERGRLEVELLGGKYSDLNDLQIEQMRLSADVIDGFEKQSKASEDYSSFLEKMTGEYNDLKGIVPTNTELLDKQFQSLSDAGVVLDATAEAYARNVALMLDMQSAGDKLNESIADNIASYKAERDAVWDLAVAHQELKNAIARETGGREQVLGGLVLDDSGLLDEMNNNAKGKAPKIKRRSSAYGIADGAARGEFKTGGIFDPDTIDTQVSMMDSLKDAGMDAFGAISQEIANATANWIAFGDASGQTLGEVTANVLASVSSQALAMGLMELGIGIAALTPWGAAIYGPAPIHFKSAAVLMGIGAAFGGAARVAGSASGGGKSSGGNDSKQNPSEYFSSNNSDDRSMNYLRQSQSSQADRRNMILGDKINQFVSAVETFDKKVNSTKPGDVFIAGANQNRGIFAERTTQEIGRNSTAASAMGRRLPSRG